MKAFLKWLSPRGTANRLDWWLITMVSALLSSLPIPIAILLLMEKELWGFPIQLLLLILVAFGIWLSLRVTIQRYRDLKWSPWLTLMYLIPYAGWIFIWLTCGFFPSADQKKMRSRVISKKA